MCSIFIYETANEMNAHATKDTLLTDVSVVLCDAAVMVTCRKGVKDTQDNMHNDSNDRQTLPCSITSAKLNKQAK